MPQIVLKLKIDTSKLEKYLFDEVNVLLQKISNNTFASIPALTRQIKELTREIYEDGAMITGLTSNQSSQSKISLRGHFGIPKGDEREIAQSILDIIEKNIYVSFSGYTLVGRRLSGRLSILLSPNVYNDLMSADFAKITTEKGETLPWIDWTLTAGDNPVIAEYRIYATTNRKTSRSGLAIMVRSSRDIWKVPSEVSGTLDDNWLTRELKKYKDMYLSLVQKALQKEFNRVL